MKFMKKLLSCVTSAEYAVMVAAFVAMVASYFISVLNRNFIQASMPWTEEIAIYSMTYMALLGTEVGLRDGTGSGDCRGGQTTRCGPQDCGSYPAGDSGGICFYHD